MEKEYKPIIVKNFILPVGYECYKDRIRIKDLSSKKFCVIATVDIRTEKGMLITKRKVKFIYYKKNNDVHTHGFYPHKNQDIVRKLSNKYGKKMMNIFYDTIEITIVDFGTKIEVPMIYSIPLTISEVRKIKLNKLNKDEEQELVS